MPKIIWLGHDAFLLEHNETRIVIDPFLSGNPTAKVKAASIKVQYILLTHGHGDHFGDTADIAKANNALIIAPFELAVYCANIGLKSHPMHIGGGYQFPFGRVKLTIAHHGSGMQTGDKALAYMGNPCGFLIHLAGKTIYHSGDTGLFMDMKLIGDRNAIDLAMLPIGDNFTMDIDDAVYAAELLRPKLVVPMHYNTFDVIHADPKQFAEKVTAKGMQARILQVGEVLEI